MVEGSLTDAVTTRADIVAEFEDGLTPINSPERAVVTAVRARQGDTVRSGSVPVEINGRPVFVLPGAFAFYRDLKPGLTGPDVSQLQSALTVAGHPIAERERTQGTYGRTTRQAVAAMYEAAGFEPAVESIPASPDGDPQPPDGDASTDTTTPAPPADVPYLPLSEVMVAPRLPARVVRLPAVGATPGGSPGDAQTPPALVVLASGNLVARAEVAPSAAVRLQRDLEAVLTADDGTTAVATVASIETAASAGGTDDAEGGEGTQTVVLRTDQPLPSSWAGTNVLATVTVGVVTDDALLVPSRGVTTRADGRTYVAVARDGEDGGFDDVEVTELGTLNGMSAVRPVDEGRLQVGDAVRVG